MTEGLKKVEARLGKKLGIIQENVQVRLGNG